jgi:hypothetical protein
MYLQNKLTLLESFSFDHLHSIPRIDTNHRMWSLAVSDACQVQRSFVNSLLHVSNSIEESPS